MKTPLTLVIAILGLVLLSVVIGGIILTAQHTTIPDSLIGIGTTAIGSLGSLLVIGKVAEQPAPAVEDPVEVDEDDIG